MTNQYKVLGVALATAAAMSVGQVASAVTIAHWDFETDLIAGSAVSGQTVSHPGANGIFEAALEDISGNNNHLSAYSTDGSNFAVMQFSDTVSLSNQTGSTLSIGGAPDDCCEVLSTSGDLQLGGSSVAELSAWTIEATVNFSDLGGWQTMVGKDGVGQATNGDGNQAPLYFQKKGDGTNQFRINYVDVLGNVHVVDSSTAVQTDTWYNVAATNDGSTLRLFVNGFEEGSLDLTTASADTRMVAVDAAGLSGTDPHVWTVARGMYANGHGDRLNGLLDDIRISNEALTVGQLLNGTIDSLTLVVNPDTGEVMLRNDSLESVAMDYYRIDSAAGDLSTTAWNSLSDQGIDSLGAGPGQSWGEASGAISANLLVEQFLEGDTVLAPGESIALGSPYAGSGEGDLELQYAKTGRALTSAPVVYSNLDLPGDFNNDGSVDAADYTVWRDTTGTDDLTADHSGDGRVNQVDYNIWSANFGSFTALTSSAIPEPTSLAVAVLACLGGVAGRRR